MKRENCGFWDDHDEMKVSLNLSVNYQEVLDAWSDRGSLWTDEYSLLMANNGYVGIQISYYAFTLSFSCFFNIESILRSDSHGMH